MTMEQQVATMRDTPNRRANAGYTLPAFARHYGLSLGQVKRAVKREEIHTVDFAGRKRIPPDEAERLENLFGWKPRGEDS